MNKKTKERKVLKYFIKLRNLNCRILNLNEAKKQFPNYNKENPDFIILNKDNHTYTGIEVFRMDVDKSKRLFTNKAKNLSELKAFLEKRGEEDIWYLNEDITDILDERLSDKLNKLINYVGNIPIWFIGYADQPFNFNVLARNIRRETIKSIKEYFSKKLNARKLNRLIQVWVIDNRGNAELMYENKTIHNSSLIIHN